MFMYFLFGVSLGALIECLARASKKIFGVFCLVTLALFVVSFLFTPNDIILSTESHLLSLNSVMFILGNFIGNFIGDIIYDLIQGVD